MLQTVIAQGTLLRCPRSRVDLDDAERTGRNTVATTITHIGLNDHRVELGADDGSRRAHLEATGLHAVFTHIAHHQPAAVAAVGAKLLDELDVPPVDAIQTARVVIAVAAELPHATVFCRELIPLLTGHLAGLAANTHRGVGVEPHCLGHHALSTLHTKALPS